MRNGNERKWEMKQKMESEWKMDGNIIMKSKMIMKAIMGESGKIETKDNGI